ncbi:MAG: NAD-dependent epimerase/dehydratase family protein [Bacteroidia bacterium]|nr:NAD-dependent epimerase/dehydratase family protein [Bacteroidia bacterium]
MLPARILVTGATGFLGGRLTERLLDTPGVRRVTATGRNAAAGQRLQALGAEFVPGDLAAPGVAEELLRDADAVVHCAALSAPWGPHPAFVQANVTATERLLAAMERQGVRRMVHISTPSVYFNFRDRFGIREDEPLPARMVNAYAETKRTAELRVLDAAARGLEAVILRPRAIIGRGDTVIMPRVLAAYRAGRLRIIGSGRTLVDVTCVSNLCDAILLGLEAGPAAQGQIFNLTNGDPVNLWDLFAEVMRLLGLPFHPRRAPYGAVMALAGLMEAQARLTGREPVLTRYSAGILACSMTHDISRARELLGYAPRQGNFEGAAEFAEDWLRQQGQRIP